VYINDIGAFSTNWEHLVKLLHTILTKLLENSVTVSPLKYDWTIKETDLLGYWLTPAGLIPWKKKIDAFLKMEALKSLKQLCGFISMVHYYQDMLPQ
jgi:hypothetical protein